MNGTISGSLFVEVAGADSVRVGDIDERNEAYRLTSVRNIDGRVIEFSGSIVLEPGERVVSYRTGFRPNIWRVGRKKGALKGQFFPTTNGTLTMFFPGDGWGTLYLTDRRIFFLRKPALHHLAEVYNVSPYDIESTIPIANLQRAIGVMSGHGMEFLEIRYEDIIRYDCGLGSADIRFRVVDGEYVLRLPRKVFDDISTILDAGGIQGKTKVLAARDIPFFWMAAASVECLILLTWMFSDSNSERRLWFILGILFPLIALYLLSRKPRLRNVMRKQWGMSRSARTKAILAFSASVAFLLPGSILSYFHRNVVAVVFTMAFVSIFAVAGLFLRRDWKIWSRFEGIVPREYRCPSCRKTVTRNDVGCSSCGSCIWWTCKVTLHRPRRKLLPGFFR